MPSEHEAGKGRKFRLVDDPDESWREFGRSDPYFGVLSADRYRAENIDDAALADFFSSGEQHVERVLEIIRKHLGTAPAREYALDFGCGVGRLALPLARHFSAVVGVDISDAYLTEAARNRDRKGLANIEFVDNLDGLVAQQRQFDLVHSYIVFNHISWERGKNLIAALFDLLRKDGVLALHVLHKRHAGAMRRAVSLVRRNFLPLHWLINLGRGRPLREPLMQGNEYRLDVLLPFLDALGAQDFHIQIETVPGGDSFAFVFCRKG